MTNIPYPPQRPLAVGEVLDLTFRIYRATLAKCVLFAGAALLFSQAANLYSLARGRGVVGMQSMLAQFKDPMFWVVYLVALALVLAFHAAVMRRQYAMLNGEPLGGEVSYGLRRAPFLFLLYLLILLACTACFIVGFAFSGAVRGLVVILMLIPLSYVIVASSSAWVVLIVAGWGPIASFARSWRLTSGSFWRLSAIYTVGLIVLIVLYLLIASLAAFLAAVIGHGDVAVVAATTSVIVVALGALVTPFYSAMALAVFGDLTVRKEGADLEQRIAASA